MLPISSSIECESILGYYRPSSMISTSGSSTHFSRVSDHCWTPSPLNALPSTLKPMAKQRSSIRRLCTSRTYINLRIFVVRMRFFPMFNTTTTWLSISPTAIAPFRWGWDSNPWVPLMLHYLLQPHKQILPMFILRSKNPPDSFSRFTTSSNRSMRFSRNPMLSTSNTMIYTR
jgi:hypothetical protein